MHEMEKKIRNNWGKYKINEEQDFEKAEQSFKADVMEFIITAYGMDAYVVELLYDRIYTRYYNNGKAKIIFQMRNQAEIFEEIFSKSIKKVYILKLFDGDGRGGVVGGFTSLKKLNKYKEENPISIYDYYEETEIKMM